MNRRHFLAVALWAVLAAALQTVSVAHADDDWIATWTASPHEVWAPDFLAPVKVPRNLWAQTVRQVASVSIGGQRVRVIDGRHPSAHSRESCGRVDQHAVLIYVGSQSPAAVRGLFGYLGLAAGYLWVRFG